MTPCSCHQCRTQRALNDVTESLVHDLVGVDRTNIGTSSGRAKVFIVEHTKVLRIQPSRGDAFDATEPWIQRLVASRHEVLALPQVYSAKCIKHRDMYFNVSLMERYIPCYTDAWESPEEEAEFAAARERCETKVETELRWLGANVHAVNDFHTANFAYDKNLNLRLIDFWGYPRY